MKEQTTWAEAAKVTGIIMGSIVAFWSVFFLICQIIQHWYQIKMFFGFGGQIL